MRLNLTDLGEISGIAQKAIFHSSGFFLTLWLYNTLESRVYGDYLVLIATVEFISPIFKLGIPTILLKDNSQTDIRTFIGEWNYFYLFLGLIGAIILGILINNNVLSRINWFILLTLIASNYQSLFFNLIRRKYRLEKILFLETFTKNVTVVIFLLIFKEKTLEIVLTSYLIGIILTLGIIMTYANKKDIINFNKPKKNFFSSEKLSITSFNILQSGPRQLIYMSFSYFRIVEFLPTLKIALSLNNLIKIPNVYFVTKYTPTISKKKDIELRKAYFDTNRLSFAFTTLTFIIVYGAATIPSIRNTLGIDLSIILLSAAISLYSIIEAKFSMNSTFLILKNKENQLLKNFLISNAIGLLFYFTTYLTFYSYQISIIGYFIINSLFLNILNNKHINFSI